MPNLTNRVPSYRLHKASGQAIVTLDGKDHYLGAHGTDQSKGNYDRITAEWLANRRQAPITEKPTGDLFINELIDVYWDYVVQYYVKGGKPTGEQQAIKYSLRPLSELYGDLPVDHFGPAALRTVRQRMIEQDWCRKLINTRINRIRRMFKWAVEHELAQSHILEGFRAVAPLKRGRNQYQANMHSAVMTRFSRNGSIASSSATGVQGRLRSKTILPSRSRIQGCIDRAQINGTGILMSLLVKPHHGLLAVSGYGCPCTASQLK